MKSPIRHIAAAAVILALSLAATANAQADHGGQQQGHGSFLGNLAAAPSLSASIVPANGDGNPYGVAIVPKGFPSGGTIHAGDILVSNFNNGDKTPKQGEGTTIVAVTPGGSVSTFFSAPAGLGPVGLTTALVALRSGIVVVGNTPTTDGTPATVSNGSLIFINRSGHVLLNLTNSKLLQGPWDMTAEDSHPADPVLFVSDVLSGTITRIQMHIAHMAHHPSPHVRHLTQVASGFAHRTDKAALLVGPTGLLLAKGDRENGQELLYVADTGNDRIQRVTLGESGGDSRNARSAVNTDASHAGGAGETVAQGAPLQGPLALAWAPNGDIVTSNGDAAGPQPEMAKDINRVVEINPDNGKFVATRQLDTSVTPGAIFGITIGQVNHHESLIYVNDNSNTLNVTPRK
jgi:hypothetical protein